MKKLLKILGIVFGLLVLAIAATAAWVGLTDTPTYETKSLEIQLPTDSLSLVNGAKIARTVCAYCHQGESGKLDGKLFSPESEGFGEIWSGNLTNHPTAGLGKYKDGEIAYLLRTGIKRDGKLAGPFMFFPNLSDEDMADVIAFLRSDAPEVQPADDVRSSRYSFLAKALIKFGAFQPLDYEGKPLLAPPTTDQVAFGRYLATTRYDCAGCHSASFETNNIMEPEKSPGYLAGGNPIADHDFNHVPSRNITPHPEQGIGKWTKEQFVASVRSGIRPDGTALSTAMPRFVLQDEEEIDAIWAYLQTVSSMETTIATAGK
ncbi:MAG: c-type cytochrome [Saprospiraceae bacterium]|nr:c-type cytochrome [Saprospiraceae bacterium]MCF8249234.1 c-type cytochrome [Saprospiraceae bacterium]MCF8280159.1 c-type cytochrome [Bacteroidales bacterium]MCF8311363.1 c-type cytochrome [Saprospiraceae bacterium]MCF8442984.1 c-type cytochrome [Saprospiraceae bacterium]